MLNVKPIVGVDCDDVLYMCNEYACRLATEKYGLNPPLSIEEITSWSPRHNRSDLIFEYYDKAEFFETQPLFPGAQEFIRNLLKIADVYFVTAVEPRFMGIRINRLLMDFPEIPKEHIIMGYQKNLIHVDFLLDDSPNNIRTSSAKYPVIFRRPWNRSITDTLSVSNYTEFLLLIEQIQKAKEPVKKEFVILYGPSGSGKTEIMKHMGMQIVGSVTTRPPRAGDVGYTYISKDDFFKHNYLEYSEYAGHYYGTRREDVIHGGIKAMDITGAVHIRTSYENAVLVFVKRPKEEIVREIIKRDVSLEDKVKRICTLDQEYANEQFADFVLENTGSIDDAVRKLKRYLAEK